MKGKPLILTSEDEQQKAREFALNYLSYRPRSSLEVYNRLLQKGYAKNIAEETVAYLTERKYLDDLKFAREWAGFLLDHKMAGPRMVQQDLRLKGVSDEIIEQILAELYGENKEREVAERLISKKIGQYQRLKRKEGNKLARRLFDLLRRHGFSQAVIHEVWSGKGENPFEKGFSP